MPTRQHISMMALLTLAAAIVAVSRSPHPVLVNAALADSASHAFECLYLVPPECVEPMPGL
jgi:hypothetical protein